VKIKAIKITEDIHERLTQEMGLLMAKSGKPQTYADAIRALIDTKIVLPQEMMTKIQEIVSNKELGYISPEEFVKDAIRDKFEAVAKRTRASKDSSAEKA
jgi:hypothetical protein